MTFPVLENRKSDDAFASPVGSTNQSAFLLGGTRGAQKSRFHSLVGVLGLCAVFAASALAQPQPPRGPMDGRPDGRGPRGGGMMRRSAKMRLPRLVEGAARLSGTNALSKKQARRLVSLVSPWRSRPQMTEEQAQTVLSGVSGVLTSAQQSAMEMDRPRFGGPRGEGGGPRDERGDERGDPRDERGGPRDERGGPRGERGGQGGPRDGRGGPRFGDERGGGPRGGRDFGGPREGFGAGQRPTEAQRNAMRTMMASFNPLYSGASRQMAGLPERATQRMERQRDRLNAALSQLQQQAR